MNILQNTPKNPLLISKAPTLGGQKDPRKQDSDSFGIPPLYPETPISLNEGLFLKSY